MKTGLEECSQDIVILCLAMWGCNCEEFILESNHILDTNGTLLIIEPRKRWTDDNGDNKLKILLEQNNFIIKTESKDDKFMFINCIKK